MRSPFYSMWLVIVVGLALGTLANRLSPRGLAWRGDWTDRVAQRARDTGLPIADLEETRRLVAAGQHLILDARPLAAYHEGHLPNALSLPWEEVDLHLPIYAALFEPDTPILVYCTGSECEDSIDLGARLHEMGCTNVILFAGGWAAWADTGTGGAP